MESKFKALICNENDVLGFGDYLYRISKFQQGFNQSSNDSLAYKLQQELSSQGIYIKQHPSKTWFNQGIDCEILTLGSQSWKKGKVKFQVSIEFYIEEDVETTDSEHSEIIESESPLDDLRRMINEGDS